MNRSIQAFAFAIILLGLTATRARAGAIITLDDVTVAPGGMGTMDITVTSDSSDTLSAFGLELQITPVSAASVLQFTTSQPDPYGNSNYVFYNESFNADNGSIPFWNVSSPPSPFLTILGGDSDDSNQGYVSIPSTPGGSRTYLATVQFQAPQGATQGDTFQISLVNDPNFTYFAYDQNYDLLNYTSTGGTVMISSVPEPSSLTVVALCGLSGLLWYC